MLKVKNIILLLAPLIVFGLITNNTLAAGWSSPEIPHVIYPSSENNGLLTQHSSMVDPDESLSPSYYILAKDNPLFNEIYTLHVSSQARKPNINLHLINCCSENNFYPGIYKVIAN